jgi:hypothetical protein
MAKAWGRPRKFQSVDELEEMIDNYFRECDPHLIDVEVVSYPQKKMFNGRKEWSEDDYGQDPEIKIVRQMSKQVPYGVAGLAYACGTTRDILLLYESGQYDLKEGDEDYDPHAPTFSNTIKMAKSRMLVQKEARFLNGEMHPAIGIFDLKVNHGYVDAPLGSDDDDKPKEVKITIGYGDTNVKQLPPQSRVNVPNEQPDDEPPEAELVDADDEETPVIRVLTPDEV